MGAWAWGFEFRVSGFGTRDSGPGHPAPGFDFTRFRVSGFKFRITGVPADCHGSKCSTNMKTGTATIGWGSDEHTAHASVLRGDTLLPAQDTSGFDTRWWMRGRVHTLAGCGCLSVWVSFGLSVCLSVSLCLFLSLSDSACVRHPAPDGVSGRVSVCALQGPWWLLVSVEHSSHAQVLSTLV